MATVSVEVEAGTEIKDSTSSEEQATELDKTGNDASNNRNEQMAGESESVISTESNAAMHTIQNVKQQPDTENSSTDVSITSKKSQEDEEANISTDDIIEQNDQKIEEINISPPDSGRKQEVLKSEMVNMTTNNATEQEDSSEKPILETLTFGLNQEEVVILKDDDQSTVCPCLLCDCAYAVWHKEHILAHLVMQHKIIIADVTFIADLPAYLQYWKKRFDDCDDWKTEFCSNIVTNNFDKSETSGPKEEFYMMCDALAEDKQLRSNLQQKRLEFILSQQQKEREEDKFFRQCLFCKQTFCGNRSVLFEHLLKDHSFHMGLPDNLVFTDELFDLIQFKIDNHLCLFCEKKFRDKTALREHMRKKQHRKINPKNKEYDRFYIINYMEVGKNWESLQSEDRRLKNAGDEKHSDEDDEWAGWNDDSESKVVCLFCDENWATQKELHEHMKTQHDFDLRQMTEKLQLNFYQKIKLINYIRRQIYHKRCYGCKKIFQEKAALLEHIVKEPEHLKKIPEVTVWDQPQYFFPTYEDDNLLCLLDDNDDDGAAGDAAGVAVIAEDIKISNSIFNDADLCKDLKKL